MGSSKFEVKTDKNPTLGAANAYDIFNLVVAAAEGFRDSTKPKPSQIANELTTIKDFNGVLGNLSVNEDGIVISKVAIRMIKDGKPVDIDN